MASFPYFGSEAVMPLHNPMAVALSILKCEPNALLWRVSVRIPAYLVE